jgi:tetratricopeptide (TPR) repeat protein
VQAYIKGLKLILDGIHHKEWVLAVRLPGYILTLAVAAVAAAGQTPDLAKAQQLYEKTEYRATIRLIEASPVRTSVEAQALAGQSWYMLGEFKKAVECFQRAVAASPETARHHHWLGRAWGRRAETSNMLVAPKYASNARKSFERAVELDRRNQEAVNDLFTYYLEAPGFLGGGIDKATKLSEQIRANDPAEYHYALAQIAIARKQYDIAEGQLKRAVELAPKQIGRLVDLAKFFAGRGRWAESEATFQRAAKIDPNHKQLLYTRAETYVEGQRNLDEAKRLLEEYLRSPLTPEDPSREEALKLLEKAGGG